VVRRQASSVCDPTKASAPPANALEIQTFQGFGQPADGPRLCDFCLSSNRDRRRRRVLARARPPDREPVRVIDEIPELTSNHYLLTHRGSGPAVGVKDILAINPSARSPKRVLTWCSTSAARGWLWSGGLHVEVLYASYLLQLWSKVRPQTGN
jgi:hypothetical protein